MRKLVRIKMPTIAEQNGNKMEHENMEFNLNAKEAKNLFVDKFIEEAEEVRSAKTDEQTIQELADLAQALKDYVALLKVSEDDFKSIMRSKEITRGRFFTKNNRFSIPNLCIMTKGWLSCETR